MLNQIVISEKKRIAAKFKGDQVEEFVVSQARFIRSDVMSG